MPKVSEKGKNMPASPIRKLVPFADIAKSKGKKIFHLNIGQPDIKTPAEMLNAIKNIDFDVWAYTHSEGNLSYRTKLVKYYDSVGMKITPEEIIVTTGGSEAISIALNSCLDNGDEVIIPEPFYANYNGFTIASGVTIKPIVSTLESGFALPPISEFEKLITPKTKAIIICNPNNPTGYLYSREEMEQLKELVLKHDLFLMSDEAYREFCYDDREFVSPMHLKGLENHAIIFDTVSKRYSACGARLGALITKNKEVLKTAMKFAQARLSPPSIGQIAAEAALSTPKSYFDNVITEYVSRRDLVITELRAMVGVEVPVPGGAFYCVAQLPVDDADKFCQWMLEDFDLEGQTVMMAPGSGFYSNAELGKRQVRIAYVLNKDDLQMAMACLRRALNDYPGRLKVNEEAISSLN
ncbi:MAG: aspartate aminotransferase [Sphingobacteriales bacterium]|jgi:aspartate aminotransferase